MLRVTPKTAAHPDARVSSDERRDQVIAAAVKEFAAHGYHAASTTNIAKRAGISQPYIYALFPNKLELFLAAHKHVIQHIRDAFTEAARGKGTVEERMAAMGEAYMRLLENRDEILLQMQAHAAAGDPGLREPVREEFERLFDDVSRISGADAEQTVMFMAKGMLLNVVAALDLPRSYVKPEAGDAA